VTKPQHASNALLARYDQTPWKPPRLVVTKNASRAQLVYGVLRRSHTTPFARR
jgi:hypothetical protein